MTEHGSRSVSWTGQTRAFTRRHVQKLRRNKLLVFLAVGWPVLWYILTMTFFIDDPDPSRLGYVKAANGISYGLFGAFTVTVAVFAGDFARDLEGDRYRKLRAMPVSPAADLTGRFLAGLALGVGSYLVTVLAAAAHGATFVVEGMGPTDALLVVAAIALTLVLFCVIAMALATVLALVITKPEHMTTIAVVVVLMAFFLTGFNGVVPGMIAEEPTFVNYLPNSLATRMQITAWAGTDNVDFLTPPEAPLGIEYGALLVGYTVALSALAVGIMRRFAYGVE